MNDRTPLNPETPHLPVLAAGQLGHLFPWVLCQHGDNLRFAIGRLNDSDEHSDEHVDIDITTPAERGALRALADAIYVGTNVLPPARVREGGAP